MPQAPNSPMIAEFAVAHSAEDKVWIARPGPDAPKPFAELACHGDSPEQAITELRKVIADVAADLVYCPKPTSPALEDVQLEYVSPRQRDTVTAALKCAWWGAVEVYNPLTGEWYLVPTKAQIDHDIRFYKSAHANLYTAIGWGPTGYYVLENGDGHLVYRWPIEDGVTRAIRGLYDAWMADRGVYSSPDSLFRGAHYHAICHDFGTQAVRPLLLLMRERRGGATFSTCLRQITGVNPAKHKSLQAAGIREAWLAWGRLKGYLTDDE